MVARPENGRESPDPLPSALLRQSHLDVVLTFLQMNLSWRAVPVVFVYERRLLGIPADPRMRPLWWFDLATVKFHRRAMLVPLTELRRRGVAAAAVRTRKASHANPRAAVDEWSRDFGVGANYFSQQAVARLIPAAGIDMPDIPADAFPRRLKRVQELMVAGDERARKIYETIGTYFGYSVAHYCDFYKEVRHIEVLGRVMTGEGGAIILKNAREIIAREFPEYANVDFFEPDEREKRHGQAAAAASLPLA